MAKFDADLNITVELSDATIEALKEDAEAWHETLEDQIAQFIENAVDVECYEGEAWICAVDNVSAID